MLFFFDVCIVFFTDVCFCFKCKHTRTQILIQHGTHCFCYHFHRPLTTWTIGLPLECDEYSGINGEYLSNLIHSTSYNLSHTGIDVITEMKGFTFIGEIDPGTPLTFTMCLKNISSVDNGEYSVGGKGGGSNMLYANDGRVQVPDICLCNLTVPTINPTIEPTCYIIIVFFWVFFCLV